MNLNTKRKIDRAFFNYEKMRQAGVQSTIDWAEQNMAIRYDDVKVKRSPSAKREARLCAFLDDNMKKYRWCRVVENVLIRYHGLNEAALINMRFFQKKPIEEVAIAMNVDRATIFRWLNRVRDVAAEWAGEYGLI